MAKNMVKNHIKALESLKGATIEAGWFESDRYEDGSSVSERARKLEYGFVTYIPSSKGAVRITVPARPFMRYAYELFLKQRREMEYNIARKIFSGKIDAEQALGQIGLAMEGCIVRSIKTGPWVKNSYFTIRQKGFDKPLVETGHMWQTVSSKVTK